MGSPSVVSVFCARRGKTWRAAPARQGLAVGVSVDVGGRVCALFAMRIAALTL